MRDLALRLPVPTSPAIDFTRVAAPNAREIFPEPRPVDRRTPGEKLQDLRLQLAPDGTPETIAKTESLLFEYAHLEQRITAFLAEERETKLKRLEAKRGELWAACRIIEDAIAAHVQEVGRLNAVSNGQAGILSAARTKVHEATQPPFHTNFPNEAETQAWKVRQASARGELAKALEQQQQINLALSAARALHAEAARELAERVEQLRAADSALIEFSKASQK
jgi:hypothetical protein